MVVKAGARYPPIGRWKRLNKSSGMLLGSHTYGSTSEGRQGSSQKQVEETKIKEQSGFPKDACLRKELTSWKRLSTSTAMCKEGTQTTQMDACKS